MEIQQIFNAIFGSLNNIVAAIVIAILTVIAIIGMFRKSTNHKVRHFARQSPAILATVGIFFSFWGISIGLIGLDLNDIQNSIPKLLDGLKVKFIASLMGIGASIIVRIAQNFAVEDIVEKDSDEKIINLLADIHNVLSKNENNSPEVLLQELKQAIDELPIEFRKQTTLLDSIKSSLAGEGDASVTTQLGKLRTDMRDSLKDLDTNNQQRSASLNNTLTSNFDNLTRKFEDFARIVAENNSKAFIEALEKAMRDFNNNITEQFGENFKELNRAVGDLLTWQGNYKLHVETLTDNFEVALNSVTSIQSAFSDIQTRSQSFTEVSEGLGGILQKLDLQLQDLNHHLKSLDQVADSAKQAFPIIEDNLMKLTVGFKKSTEQSLADITSTVETVGENLVETTSRLKDTTGKLRESMENQRETLEKTSGEFKEVVGVTLKSLAKETKTSIENYQESLQETVTTQLDSINFNIKQSNAVVNSTIQNASVEFEKSIAETGEVLKTSTDTVAKHLTNATDSMKGMIEEQQSALSSTSTEFKTVVNQTLRDLSDKTQASIQNYQESLEKAVTKQLDSIDSNIQKSNTLVNSTIQNAGTEFEKSIAETGMVLKTSTDTVAKHLTNATDSMKGMIEEQQSALSSTSTEFKTVVNQTLRDLSDKTQASIQNYQESLEKAVTKQLDSIDSNIQKSNAVVNTTIQNASAEFEKSIKTQAESMNKTIATAGDSFKTVIQNTAKEFEVMAETIAESVELQEKTLTNISQDVKVAVDKALRDLTEQSKASIKEYESSLHNIIMSQLNTIKDSVNTASKDFNRLLTENTEKSTSVLVQQTQLLDTALQEELKIAIETMGKLLASLSNQFVKDYSPLTDKLREVVKLAEDLNRGR